MKKTRLKTSLEHLPFNKQEELATIRELILKYVPQTEMIILFGSYARGDYVDRHYTKMHGATYEYSSDFDILVVTRRKVEDINSCWRSIRAILDKKPLLTKPTMISHDINFINERIRYQYYFFTDIIEEGIILHDSGKYELATPEDLTPQKRLEKAQDYLEYWMKKADNCTLGANLFLDRKINDKAAFELHQATENYYAALSLVFTDYKPKTHELADLRKRAININEALQSVFPLKTKEEERLFDLLCKAYVDARYNKDYKITEEELKYLAERVALLKKLVAQLCEAEIARLQAQLEAWQANQPSA